MFDQYLNVKTNQITTISNNQCFSNIRDTTHLSDLMKRVNVLVRDPHHCRLQPLSVQTPISTQSHECCVMFAPLLKKKVLNLISDGSRCESYLLICDKERGVARLGPPEPRVAHLVGEQFGGCGGGGPGLFLQDVVLDEHLAVVVR